MTTPEQAQTVIDVREHERHAALGENHWFDCEYCDDEVVDDEGYESEVITVTLTISTVEEIAKRNDIDPDLAIQRAAEWAQEITSTVSGYAYEQLESVVRFGHP